jgi:prepilin-type N-terminal cleavage/methylation domain-containing protein
MKKFCPKKQSFFPGFSLIELLVVVTITGILFGVGVAKYTDFNRSQILEQAAQELKNNLRLAQARALSGEKPSGCTVLDGYQVSFVSGGQNDTYQIGAICGGNEAGEAETFSLPSVVKFDPLPSPSQILFKVLAQGTNLENDYLTITLKGFNSDSYVKTVTVTKTGEIR